MQWDENGLHRDENVNIYMDPFDAASFEPFFGSLVESMKNPFNRPIERRWGKTRSYAMMAAAMMEVLEKDDSMKVTISGASVRTLREIQHYRELLKSNINDENDNNNNMENNDHEEKSDESFSVD